MKRNNVIARNYRETITAYLQSNYGEQVIITAYLQRNYGKQVIITAYLQCNYRRISHNCGVIAGEQSVIMR